MSTDAIAVDRPVPIAGFGGRVSGGRRAGP
jgi:hypothetical protein